MRIIIDKRSDIGKSLLATLFWIVIFFIGYYALLTDAAWHLKWYGLIVSIWIIGIWRYSWQILIAFRTFYYLWFVFPQVRKGCDALPNKYPEELYVVVASYKEKIDVTKMCFLTLVEACAKCPSRTTIVASVGSEEEATSIKEIAAQVHDSERVKLLFTLQKDGKRKALGHALRVCASIANPSLENIVILMDGDTALGHDILEKSLPIFKLMPNVGGVTTNNHALVSNNCAEIIRDWYNLKMVKRHHMMAAHAVSNRVLTMTGRFSVFRAAIALSTEFITNLEEDYVDDWLHGRIAFLMGDDKSTMSFLLKYNWDCTYVPDTYAICLEDRTGSFFDIANVLMLRWYGNMLRVNGKSIREGLSKMPFFTWVAFIDQRISMWTTLIGPVTAVLMSVCVSGYYLIFYALWVILTRWGQLVVTCGFHGHTLKVTDLPLQVFEQWYGALVKIYCQFHLHKQLWQKSRAEAQVISTGEKWGNIIAKCLMGFYFFLFALFILFCTKLVKIPGLF